MDKFRNAANCGREVCVMKIRIPYGNGYQETELRRDAVLLESRVNELRNEKDADEIVRSAMANPIGSKPLSELAAGKKNAVVIISDHTRPVPSKQILPHMLSELRAGNPEIDITLLVATGCHRGTTASELIEKLGEEIAENEKIEVHDCEHSPLTELGTLPSGAKLVINSLAAEAELLVAEGFIEPHFFAGFSGGRKSVLPGVCSRVTVLGNHCADFIDSPYACMGSLSENPINRDMEAATKMAGLAYIVNVVIDEEKHVAAAFAGDPILAHRSGCEFLSAYCSVKPERAGQIVITSNGGAPLDQNVYQAVKGLTTAEAAAASSGGILIICAECRDGIGGESFYRALKGCENIASLLAGIRRTPMEETIPDQWQYQILARILEKHRVIFVTEPGLQKEIEEMKMEYAESLEAAVEKAYSALGETADVTVIPNGVSVIIEKES